MIYLFFSGPNAEMKTSLFNGVKKIFKDLPDWKFMAGSFVAWTLIALLASGLNYSLTRNSAQPATIWTVLTYIYFFYIWIFLTPFVYLIVKFIGVKNVRDIRWSILIHLPAAFGLSLAHSFIFFSIVWLANYLFFEMNTGFLDFLFQTLYLGNLILGILAYGLAVITIQSVLFFRHYRDEEAKNLRLQSELSKAQLKALKMQLQPHFLFNTLHSISSLNLADPHRANEMIARLGEFLRMTLDHSDKQLVTLDEEIGFVRHYLEIEQIRFSDRLEVEIDAREDLLTVKVPHLILQPIVENAVKYGIAPFEEKGQIRIVAKKTK